MLIIETTLPVTTSATPLINALIEAGLAACVQTHEVGSSFHWDGKSRYEREHLLRIKTADDRRAAVEAAIAEHHPNSLPEIVVVEASASADYDAWVTAQTRGGH